MINMENGINVEQMLGMTIGQIQDLKVAQQKIQNVIDQQTESIRVVIDNNKINDETADAILAQLN